MANIVIDKEKCKGCQLCTIACPRKLIVMSTKINTSGFYPAQFEEGEDEKKKCVGCMFCARMCPDVAIEVYR